MDKFNSALRGYDKTEVNDFIDKIISRVEGMVSELSEKDKEIEDYRSKLVEKEELIRKLSSRIKKFEEEESLTREFVFDDTSERAKIEAKQLLDDAKIKSRKIIEDAEDQADLIIRECLMEASKSEIRINNLKDEIERLKQKKEMLYYK